MRRGLRIGEFQAGGADQDLRDGEYAVRNQLPCDGHGGSFLQPVLQESDNQECSGAEGQSRSEAHQGPCQRCHPGINKYGDEGDEHHDENGIGRLDLGRPMDQEPPGSGMERGIILLPWDTQEEAVCSKMDQNGMIKAKMERIFRMCRVSSTAEVPQRCSAFSSLRGTE